MDSNRTLAERYIVAGCDMEPQLHVLTAGQAKYLSDVTRVAGWDKARGALFGNGAELALLVNDAMLCYLMERAQADGLPHAALLAAMAAAIATGKPAGDGGKHGEGGQRAALQPVAPRKPRPGGANFVPQPAAASA